MIVIPIHPLRIPDLGVSNYNTLLASELIAINYFLHFPMFAELECDRQIIWAGRLMVRLGLDVGMALRVPMSRLARTLQHSIGS